jgi:hypothetical protein
MWDCGNLGIWHMSRLTVDLTDRQHQTLKALAALQDKSIKEYVLERLFPGASNGDQAWQELKILLGARINEGLAGRVSAMSVGEILNEEMSEARPD